VSEELPAVPDLGIYRAIVPDGTRCDEHGTELASFRCAICSTYRCARCLWGRRAAREVCRTCGKDGLPQPIAWERRDEIGVVRGFFGTVREVLLTPVLFFRTPALEDDAVGGFEHGLVSFGVGQIALVVQALAMLVVFGGVFAAATRVPAVAAVFGGYGCMVIALVPTMMIHVPVTTLASVGVAAVSMHATLRVLGAARAPFFAGTVRATSYAFATHVLFIVPIVGPFVAVLWTLVIEAIGVREVHRTGTLVALVAALGFRMLLVAAIVAIYVAIGAAVLASVVARASVR